MALERGVLARTVGFARRVGIHTLLGEGLLVGASAGLLVLWLGLVSGTQALGMEGLFLGGLAALMAAAAWVKGGWRDESSWARILDERLGLDGALLAGLQVERRGGSELGRLLTRDVQGRVRRKEILGKALPVRLWLVGLLVGSGSLLFHGLQQTRVPELRWQEATVVLGGATEELQDALRRAQELPEGELTPESLQELKALGAEVQKMELSQHLGQEQPEDWVQPLREIGERLDRLAGIWPETGPWIKNWSVPKVCFRRCRSGPRSKRVQGKARTKSWPPRGVLGRRNPRGGGRNPGAPRPGRPGRECRPPWAEQGTLEPPHPVLAKVAQKRQIRGLFRCRHPAPQPLQWGRWPSPPAPIGECWSAGFWTRNEHWACPRLNPGRERAEWSRSRKHPHESPTETGPAPQNNRPLVGGCAGRHQHHLGHWIGRIARRAGGVHRDYHRDPGISHVGLGALGWHRFGRA